MATMASKRDYYEVLGISRTASHTEISAAYRKLAIQFHPDKNPGDEAASTRFKECAEAFEVLGDQEKRTRYDRYGHAGVSGAGAHFGDANDIFSAFGDIFGDLGIFGGGRGGRRRARRGADVRCDVTLDLLEAARGVTKTIHFQRHEACETCHGSGAKPGTQPEACSYCGGAGQVVQTTGIFRVQTTCPACHGQGKVVRTPCGSCHGEGYTISRVEREIRIPAGVDSDTRLRLEGEGEPSPAGGPRGDCYCFISVRDHELFERQGQHLICQIPITFSQAALGATIEVPTLDGREPLEIPRGTQPAEVFRLRGRGMPDPRGRAKGDLLVQVNVEVPRKLSEQHEELLRKLAEVENTHVSPHRKSFFEKLRDFIIPDDQPTRAED